MKKIMLLSLACLAFAVCSAAEKFPTIKQNGKIAVVAHRGYWKCEAAGYSENSIASLREAQKLGIWGSECDIHLTADGIVIVNHNNDVAPGVLIAENTYEKLSQYKLPNGEVRPTLDQYLDQAATSKKTILVIELKKQPTEEIEDKLVEKTIAALKAHNLYNPKRVAFISFSDHICEVIAAKYPQFINQYLTSKNTEDKLPKLYAEKGINGVDYRYPLFDKHPDWVQQAHELGMSVNAWTADDEKDIERMIEVGVDAITSNKPETVRQLLGDKEYKN